MDFFRSYLIIIFSCVKNNGKRKKTQIFQTNFSFIHHTHTHIHNDKTKNVKGTMMKNKKNNKKKQTDFLILER